MYFSLTIKSKNPCSLIEKQKIIHSLISIRKNPFNSIRTKGFIEKFNNAIGYSQVEDGKPMYLLYENLTIDLEPNTSTIGQWIIEDKWIENNYQRYNTFDMIFKFYKFLEKVMPMFNYRIECIETKPINTRTYEIKEDFFLSIRFTEIIPYTFDYHFDSPLTWGELKELYLFLKLMNNSDNYYNHYQRKCYCYICKEHKLLPYWITFDYNHDYFK